jgi:hypothetical protein
MLSQTEHAELRYATPRTRALKSGQPSISGQNARRQGSMDVILK